MASTHKHLRSSTANKRPTTAIADGQIALNTNATSPGLYFKDSTGASIIKVGPVHIGTTAPNATPPSGGSSGNSTGEVWLDTSLTPPGVKIWNGSAWVNATPVGSTTVQGLLELATNAETQAGTDVDRAVTPAGLQSKVSDSVSTSSSTTIASSTAVKTAYDLANAALARSGGTITGNLEIGTTGSLSFEGSTADAFETTIAVVDPTADRTITLPDTTGTVVTTGDTGTVTSTMIASGTIVDSNISATAEIAVSKLADGAARQLLQTDAAGTGVEWTNNIDIPGTLDVTSTATFDSIAQHPAGSAGAPTITFTGDTNTGIYSPGADQVALSTGGTGRLFVDASGNIGLNTSSPGFFLDVNTGAANEVAAGFRTSATGAAISFRDSTTTSTARPQVGAVGNDFVIKAGNTPSERLRIDSSGRLLVGTSSSRANAFGQSDIQLESGAALLSVTQNANNQYGGAFVLSKTRGTSFQTVTNNDNLGILSFQGANGSALLEGARIQADIDGTVSGGGANDLPTRLTFSTTADGASSPTERMRIDSTGRTQLYSAGGNHVLRVASDQAAGTSIILIRGLYSATDNTTTGSESFRVFTNGNVVNSNNSYGSISDIRLKENIVDASSQWSDIKALQVRKYNFKEGQTHTQIGLIAQEVELVSPGLVSESPDRDAEGNDLGTVTKSVNYSVLYMKAVKALQEAIKRIETLEAKVAALEGA